MDSSAKSPKWSASQIKHRDVNCFQILSKCTTHTETAVHQLKCRWYVQVFWYNIRWWLTDGRMDRLLATLRFQVIKRDCHRLQNEELCMQPMALHIGPLLELPQHWQLREIEPWELQSDMMTVACHAGSGFVLLGGTESKQAPEPLSVVTGSASVTSATWHCLHPVFNVVVTSDCVVFSLLTLQLSEAMCTTVSERYVVNSSLHRAEYVIVHFTVWMFSPSDVELSRHQSTEVLSRTTSGFGFLYHSTDLDELYTIV